MQGALSSRSRMWWSSISWTTTCAVNLWKLKIQISDRGEFRDNGELPLKMKISQLQLAIWCEIGSGPAMPQDLFDAPSVHGQFSMGESWFPIQESWFTIEEPSFAIEESWFYNKILGKHRPQEWDRSVRFIIKMTIFAFKISISC